MGGEITNFNSLTKTKIIACDVFRDEIQYLGIDQSDCTFLEQGLHRDPAKLRQKLIQTIEEIEFLSSPERLILVYGYCGGGLENISTKKAQVIIPKVHDCIPLLLGQEDKISGSNETGIFYLSRGWIKYGKTPYTEYLELKKKYDPEDAYWSCKELLKNYNFVAAIKTLPDDCRILYREANVFARCFNLEYFETQGDLGFLKKLLTGQLGEKIIEIKPRCMILKQNFI